MVVLLYNAIRDDIHFYQRHHISYNASHGRMIFHSASTTFTYYTTVQTLHIIVER
jgi:hypothetical protein